MKILNRIATLFIVFGFLFQIGIHTPSSAQSLQEINILDASSRGVSFVVDVPWEHLSLNPVEIEGTVYLEVLLPGYTAISQPGAPQVPMLTQALGVPFGVDVLVSVSPGKAHTQTLDMPLLAVPTDIITHQPPSQQSEPFSGVDSERIMDLDRAIYESPNAYPGILGELTNLGVFRQQRIAGIGLYPVQYQPLSGELIIYESLSVEVWFVGEDYHVNRLDLQAESESIEAILQSNLINYDSAKEWRVPSVEMTIERSGLQVDDAGRWQPPAASWKIAVREEGMHQITYDQLQTAGLPVTTLDPDTLQMFHLGAEIAIQVLNAVPGALNPGDTIIFYGQGVDSKYTWENIYWLTFGSATGMRIQDEDGSPTGTQSVESYAERLWVEENLYYIPYAPGEDDLERYFGKFIYNISPSYRVITQAFTLDQVGDGSGKLKMALLGYASNLSIILDHQADIKIKDAGDNIVFSDSVSWDGISWEYAEFDLPPGTLSDGLYSLEITSPLPNDTFYLDWFEITYARNLTAKSDLLQFDFEEIGEWDFSIEGFSSDNVLLFDVSNPTQVRAINGAEVNFDDPDYSILFNREVTDTKSFWAGTDDNFLPVTQADILQDTPSDWATTTNGADYIVISHSDFWTQASQLAAFRNGQGLRTVLVNVQDLYDEFAHGIVSPHGIKAFLAYAYQNWQAPAPSFVVLVGDGHFDPKNYQGFGRKNFIPPFLAHVDPNLGETAADNRYVSILGADFYPEMMLGRLAVNTPAEAQAFVNKIIAYEETPIQGEWQQQVLAVADSYESGWVFPNISDNLINCCLPSTYEPERVYLGVTHPDVSSARSAIIAGINAGKFLVNYNGHAASSVWGSYIPKLYEEFMLYNSNISSLTNTDKYPVVLSMSCWDGYYIYPNPVGNKHDALAEVFTKTANKGAVAQWSNTGLSIARGLEYLNQGFYNAIFRDGLTTVGQATSAGKFFLWTSGANLELMETYLLFGDPATNMMLNISAVDDTYYMNEDESLSVNSDLGVLRNDIVPASASVSVELVGDVKYGSLIMQVDGAFDYVPDQDYFGVDSFTYRLFDGEDYSNTAAVRIYVASVNDPPVAHDQTVSTMMNTPLNITLTADDDGRGISVSSLTEVELADTNLRAGTDLLFFVVEGSGPDYGVLAGGEGSADRVYTPGEGFVGTDQFAFKAFDGEYYSEPATITITVQADGEYQIFLPLIIH